MNEEVGNAICNKFKAESFKKPEYKSVIKIGDHFKIYNDHHFNRLNKFMFKLFFGVTIEDYEKGDVNE